MYRVIFLIFVLLFITACSKNDYLRVAHIATSSNPYDGMKTLAIDRGVDYALNPKQLESDISYIKNNFEEIVKVFLSSVIPLWGESNAKEPSQDVYVKYSNSYKSRARVDFAKGEVIVESIDDKNPIDSLQKAIVTTILTPHDPEGVDLYSSKEVELKGKPYLAGLIKDHQNKVVLYKWRATQYAKYLIDNSLKKELISTKEGKKNLYYVKFDMVRGHSDVSANKYANIAKKYAIKYGLDTSLVLAIMKTESNFNPYAVSHIPAYGLMQIVPSSAGRDVYRELNKRDGVPTKNMLFDSETNIKYGTTYLNILYNRYLNGIKDSKNLEYCVTSAYNTGAGNVLRVFDRDRGRAISKINSYNPNTLYSKLRSSLPYEETRRYLAKVQLAKKEFVRY